MVLLSGLSKEQREVICCHFINHYLFDKVWNETHSEYRVNIKPMLMKNKSVVGSFSTLDATIYLPTTTEGYYVWAFSSEIFNVGLKLPCDTWVNCEDIANEYNTLLQMYSKSGAMFHKQFVWLRYNLSRSVIFVAAKKDMVRACIPTMNEVIEDVYITVYYDSDLPNDVTVWSGYKTSATTTNAFQRQIDTALNLSPRDACVQIYKNGIEVTPLMHSVTFSNGDYIDIVIDENIEFAVDIDISDNSQNPAFLSEKDATWKQLIHIPKDSNPENKIITHNTCDFWIRRKYATEPSGRYLHRVKLDDESRSTVNQVTHNDMAIPLYVLDAYRDYLQGEEITIHLVARIHDKDNVLIRDASFIDLLYVHDDLQIQHILCGGGPENIPWWRAAYLEQSKFVEMMFDVPNLVTRETLSDYVEALGFYQVVNLICKRVVDFVATDAFKSSLTFALPLLYWGYEVIPIVYINGRVVTQEYVSYTNNTERNECTVALSDEITTNPGDLLTYVFYLDGDKTIYTFIPTEDNIAITVPLEEFNIFVEEEVASGVQAVGETRYTKYIQLAGGHNQYASATDSDGNTTITVNPNYIGQRVFIQNKYCSYRYSYDLSEYTVDGKTVVIPLQVWWSDGDESGYCPAFMMENVSCFINGLYLARDIDYFVNTVYDGDDLVCHELVVQSMDHFEEGKDDVLDVIINIAEIEDISSFYVINNELRDSTPVNLYFPNISVAHVRGLLERKAEYEGIYMALPEDKYAEGDVFEIQTSVPALVKDFVLTYASNEDFERIQILNEYFYDFHQLIPDLMVKEDKHRIYSTFMNNFIYDVVNGTIPVTYDPDATRMADIIKPYEYLKEMDLCFKMLGTNHQLFVDFYPQYINYSTTPEMKRFIDFFINTYAPENIDPTVEVVYE